jgi:hypothetical protein
MAIFDFNKEQKCIWSFNFKKNSDMGLGDKTDQDQETPKTLTTQNLFVYVQ